MVLESVLQGITITSLAIVLFLFLFRLATRGRRPTGDVTDFGAVFSAFVAGWIATELLSLASPASLAGAIDILHLIVIGLFASWIIARWRWALKQAGATE